MALMIFPIGVVLGWLIRKPSWAAAATAAIGAVALVALAILGRTGAEVSPLETIVLIVGTPLAAILASRISRWRLSRRPIASTGTG